MERSFGHVDSSPKNGGVGPGATAKASPERPIKKLPWLEKRPPTTTSTNVTVVRSEHSSSVQESTRRDQIQDTRKGRKLSTIIEQMEKNGQDAVNIADSTMDQEHIGGMYCIIEDALDAIRRTSAVPVRPCSPLEVSTSPECSDCSSCTSPTYATPPQCIAEIKHKRQEINVQGTGLKPHPIGTPPQAIDWAYIKEGEMPYLCSSSTSSISGGSAHSTDSELLPKPPNMHSVHHEKSIRPSGWILHRLRSNERPTMRKHLHWPDKTGPLFCECHCKCFRAWASRNSDTLTPAHHCYVKVPYEQHVQGHKGICLHGVPQQVARNWKPSRKRITATIACMNTSLIGILVGIYAGEVPRIQYVLADEAHHALIGNVALYLGLALSTFTFWPLPLLHGRKPYVLTAMALALPLQFPQAMVLSTKRSPKYAGFRASLLLSRGISGLVLGFANANFVTVLLDLFGASLQSKHPHQEVPNAADLRKHGGGLGLWLGIWSWCWIGTLAIGFQIGASIIQNHTPDRGFYVTIIINALALVLNILASETRRSKNRRSVVEVYDRRYNILTRCVVRGEVRLHLSTRGPRHFIDELYAGMRLSFMMCCQKGFFILAIYLGWIYGQIILVIMLLGALLSREYKWKPHQIGFGVMSVAIGALLAIPLTKANVFNGKRASLLLTSRKLLGNQVTWTSHSVRRAFFIALLPILGLGFSVSCGGPTTPFVIPILFAGAIGFASVLAVAECYGLIMETFDVCDLPLGMQIPHLMKSHSSTTQDGNRQSAYSSFPRVTAGIFVSQTFAFVGAAVATAVGGILSRRISTQLCTGIMAGILLLLTIFLIAVLWRFRDVRVISSHTSKAKSETTFSQTTTMAHNGWEDVMSGSPPRRIRRMNILEMGALSRWTEIRRLNYLIRPKEEKRRWVG